ncbi:succinate dehydrogenase [Schwartzia succinivorans]|jgi:succinate dehydrogenase / fumarate reductase cytochrome b subunit|uniref:Succinate dehydrogenase subunit C n=1 Tax=Schwartzia succinivorans DSM 10502 TaxID=1123243 RepID=A0A1M4TKA7_9FIRM|nr:succinate dehydrogenase [Schwartzia succinivorans]MBQ1469573.1 succinate dehydrogenase [Schwartzia sp. (in: firmicutes)]MBE6097012.1 succinate dehydrogenase [Schwartzia succinivorans]MBQ1918445.1 succinate dehydrogenase [Schwartzia sp. (in: firmicutes)]MBQ2048444.1 succinate dehydrogenase [Schwartzia sp. (in: firmicutes)]MBQ3862752.1 succinate dehydrogenase [Schwartzia sp. (in: firmicutes)]
MFNVTFYLRRLHSLCGLVVVGGFLLEHIITNARVLISPQSFNAAVDLLASIPPHIMIPIEIALVACPFLFHAIYGAYIGAQAKNNPQHYSYIQNIQFWLQRMTAWYLLAFLIWHVVYLRVLVKGGGAHISFQLLQSYFENPVIWVLYLLGMLAAVFHFCNGITTFCMTWGIAKGPRIQKVINAASMALCALLSLVSVAFMVVYLL